MTNILTAYEAIEFAEANGLTLNTYTTPIEEAREGLTISEARDLAHYDPSLIWVAVPLSLNALNATDDPQSMGGTMMGEDGQGNQLWLFGAIGKAANRFESEDGEVSWTAEIEGWNGSAEDALS